MAENLTLITGGARSGKSEFAERLAAQAGTPVYYLATMEILAEDLEAVERVSRHRRRRPDGWLTIEEPVRLDEAIRAIPAGRSTVLLDCLSLYVSNLLLGGSADGADPCMQDEPIALAVRGVLSAMAARPDLEFVVVTNEVGSGIVPENALSRAYRDILGACNQIVAGDANRVWLVVAGLELKIK